MNWFGHKNVKLISFVKLIDHLKKHIYKKKKMYGLWSMNLHSVIHHINPVKTVIIGQEVSLVENQFYEQASTSKDMGICKLSNTSEMVALANKLGLPEARSLKLNSGNIIILWTSTLKCPELIIIMEDHCPIVLLWYV